MDEHNAKRPSGFVQTSSFNPAGVEDVDEHAEEQESDDSYAEAERMAQM